MSTRDRESEPGPLKYAPKRARMVRPEEAAMRNRPRRPSAEPVLLRAVKTSSASPSSSPPSSSPPSSAPTSSPPPSSAPQSPPMRAREPPPPWHAKTPRGAFEGDVAIKELRQRMALAPDLPPSPPLRGDRGAAPGMVLRLAGLVTLAAIAAYGFVWISTPRPQAADSASSGFQSRIGGDQPDPAAAGEESSLSPAMLRPPVRTSTHQGFISFNSVTYSIAWGTSQT